MKVEILTLCDFAQTYRDRLTIVGAFSSINAQKFPVDMTDVSFVAKIALENPDNRKHDVELTIKKDGEAEPVFGPVAAPLDLTDNKEDFLEANLIIKIGHLTIPSQGKYHLVFSFDGNETTTPLSVAEQK